MFAFLIDMCYTEINKVIIGGIFMEKLNDTQKKVYEFLVKRLQDGIPPSVREIGAAVGLKSTSSVQANLIALEEAGYIMRDPMLKRYVYPHLAGRYRRIDR